MKPTREQFAKSARSKFMESEKKWSSFITWDGGDIQTYGRTKEESLDILWHNLNGRNIIALVNAQSKPGGC